MDTDDKIENIRKSTQNIEVHMSAMATKMETMCVDHRDIKASQGRQWSEINFNSFFRKGVTAFLMLATPVVLGALAYLVKKTL